MKGLKKSVEQMYYQKERLILIGLTGRTGSGCSTVARILKEKNFDKLDLESVKDRGFKDTEERKYKIVYDYMKNHKWVGFTVIEVSSLILGITLSRGIEAFKQYLDKITDENSDKSINIGDKEKVLAALAGTAHMFEDAQDYSIDKLARLSDSEMGDEEIERFYQFYVFRLNEYKQRFRELLEGYSCFEIIRNKMEAKKMVEYHFYTYLMQQLGNNIRCSGNPFCDVFNEVNYHYLIHKVNDVIRLILKYDKQQDRKYSRICIDAIRNPYEAHYLFDKYRAFHLLAISTDDKYRRERLTKLNDEELKNLDKIEYPLKMKDAQEAFYHQNIQGCLEMSDIHIYNPNIENKKHFELTEQLIKYIALMIHPGLVTPTHLERCMQLAYNAKYNSGCLSRQVGAVVTREDFSIQSVGWNDVPKGQVSCNLRDVEGYCHNKDKETFSQFEIEDEKFDKAIQILHGAVKQKIDGYCYAYCFKDIYNGIHNDKNQVYTRALHAEENAFLQISKYGGTQVRNGFLFTTASPCELCAKKAYQLGIQNIYYIDPYPGISSKHILSFGAAKKPKMCLFHGAIGRAYMDLYSPKMAYKDELELITGIKVKDLVSGKKDACGLKYEDLKFDEIDETMRFVKDRTNILCLRKSRGKILCTGLEKLRRTMVWTGSAYDGMEIDLENSEEGVYLEELDKEGIKYPYFICFSKEKGKNEPFQYATRVRVKDERQIMEPYFAHIVKNDTDKLRLRLIVPRNIIEDVQMVIYADTTMELKISSEPIEGIDYEEESGLFEYSRLFDKPNVNYTYGIEWKWKNRLQKIRDEI